MRQHNDLTQLSATTVMQALWPLVFLMVGLVWPVVFLFSQGPELIAQAGLPAPTEGLWRDPYLRWRVLWTLSLAALTTCLCCGLGLPLAWLLARLHWPFRDTLLRLVLLPFVVPTLVAALGLLAVWGPHGLLAGWLPTQGLVEQGPVLLLLGHLFFNLGLVIKAGVMGLQSISASRLAAARSLGATPWRAFWRVEWPALQPHLLAALCVVFLYSFSSFGLALVLGGQRYATLEVEIYTRVAHDLDLVSARQLAGLSALLLSVAVALHAWWSMRLAQPSRNDPPPVKRPDSPLQWLAVAMGCAILLMVCVAPLVAVVAKALTRWDALPPLLADPETLLAIANTLRFSLAGVMVALVTGGALAFAARRSPLMRPLLGLPLVISPVTIGFGYLVAYPFASAHMGLLVMAYALLAIPLVAQPVLAALDTLPANAYAAARSLGASRVRAFVRVTLPQLAPALRRGAALALATCLGEFAVTLFLSRPEWSTVGTLVYQYLGRPGQANFDAALLLSALLLAITLLLFWLLDPPRQSQPTDGLALSDHV